AFPLEAELDLHGLTAQQAQLTLQDFLRYALQRGKRCVRIVHGKGYRSPDAAPVLKNQVNSWLRQYAAVLAFTSAAPRDGGTGAVWVLLRGRVNPE
ncbi:MAG: Smr/MutS family protein, partial [Methylococcales bacterium]|nr:Smr/MutS family protein [Methylococcales bacterium]